MLANLFKVDLQQLVATCAGYAVAMAAPGRAAGMHAAAGQVLKQLPEGVCFVSSTREGANCSVIDIPPRCREQLHDSEGE